MPRPAVSRRGNTKTQKTASGSRKNSRYRTKVSWTSECSVQRRRLFVTELPSGQSNEDVLERSRVGTQLGKLRTLPPQLPEEERHRAVQFGHLKPVAPVAPGGGADAIQRGEGAV